MIALVAAIGLGSILLALVMRIEIRERRVVPPNGANRYPGLPR